MLSLNKVFHRYLIRLNPGYQLFIFLIFSCFLLYLLNFFYEVLFELLLYFLEQFLLNFLLLLFQSLYLLLNFYENHGFLGLLLSLQYQLYSRPQPPLLRREKRPQNKSVMCSIRLSLPTFHLHYRCLLYP